MVKRKVVTKNVPPDVTAAKILISLNEFSDNLQNLTDAELENEKQRLLKILNETNGE